MSVHPQVDPTRLILTLTPIDDRDGYWLSWEHQDIWTDDVRAAGGGSTADMAQVEETIIGLLQRHRDAMSGRLGVDRLPV